MPESGTPPRLPDRATTPLLTLITQESLDEDYEHVAERRAASGDERPASRRPRVVAAVVLAAFGTLVAVAAVQTSEQSGVESAGRRTLVEQISEQRERLAVRQDRDMDLRELNVGLEGGLESADDAAAAARARADRLAAQTGFAPVSGPGVVFTVDDAPDGEAVRDEDLALLVDGLWNAGAEAISINGKRLTARSAIRNSGPAINLNGPPPLSPPYVVSAIGDPRTLSADLLDSNSGLAFSSRVESFGFPFSMDNVVDMTLPAAPSRLERLSSVVQGSADQKADKAATKRKETAQ